MSPPPVELAAAWAAWRQAVDAVLDYPLDSDGMSDSDREELFGWVRAEMEARHARALAAARDIETGTGIELGVEPDREALAHHIMQMLGWGTLGSDPHGEHGLAWTLCEDAGWPEGQP